MPVVVRESCRDGGSDNLRSWCFCLINNPDLVEVTGSGAKVTCDYPGHPTSRRNPRTDDLCPSPFGRAAF